MDALNQKAADDAANFAGPKKIADKVTSLTKTFYDYVGSLKATVTEGLEVDEETGKLPYESMDKADAIDNTWFKGDAYTDNGNEIIDTGTKINLNYIAGYLMHVNEYTNQLVNRIQKTWLISSPRHCHLPRSPKCA
jgi:hypothetical protein